MSDYNPTYTYQWRDYKSAITERDKWWGKVNRLRKKGASFLEATHKAGHMPKASLITEERPNPLSMELRIVLVYFWELYNDCLKAARQAYRGGSEATPASYRAEAIETLAHVRNLCHNLFAVTSCFHPFHIHSEYGCNDEDCPAWKRGYEAAQENMLDWYSPD